VRLALALSVLWSMRRNCLMVSFPAGAGLAAQRLGASSRLRVVDAILSGTHEPFTSHYQLLRAFVDDETLGRIDQELSANCYRTHEFGDSVFSKEPQEKCAQFVHLHVTYL